MRALFGMLALALLACADPPKGSPSRGRALYHRGEAPGARLEGALDRDGTTLSGRDAACAHCHGLGAEGRREGAIAVPSLRPERLFSPRERGYDMASLRRAVQHGISREGRSLRTPMPRYALDDGAARDLFAYLQTMGHEREDGVFEDRVQVGAVVPEGDRGALVRDVLKAIFEEAKSERRHVEVVVESAPPGGEREAMKRLRDRGVFALVSSLLPPSKGDVDDDLPLVLPLSPAGDLRGFALFPSSDAMARVAVAHISLAGLHRLVVVHEDDDEGRRWVSSARREALRRGLPEPRSAVSSDAARVAVLVTEARADAVLFAGTRSTIEVPLGVQVYAMIAEDRVPLSLRERTWVLHPSLPAREMEQGLSHLASLLRHGTKLREPALAAHAAVAARLFDMALRRAGSPPTREGLRAALEAFREVETGLSPPVTFARDRHVGVLGGRVGRVGERGNWIELMP